MKSLSCSWAPPSVLLQKTGAVRGTQERRERSRHEGVHVGKLNGTCSDWRQNRDVGSEGAVGIRVVEFNAAEASAG